MPKLDTGEWGNAEQIFNQFGLAKGTLWKLSSQGRIRSVLIKTDVHARKGTRLFSIQSIRDFLAASLS